MQVNPYESPESRATLEPASTKGAIGEKATSYRKTLWAIAVFIGLYLLMGPLQGILSTLTLGFFVVAWQVVLLALAFFRRQRDPRALRFRLVQAGMYAVMLFAMFLHAVFEYRVARSQAEQLVQACHAYEEDHGHLPEDLSQIVPEYLPSLPHTLGFLSKKIYYYVPPEEDNPASFMFLPEPFTRSWYNFETREWRSYAT